jgi:site-specific DNA-methyltransferase (adenine-specific)/adenine-specific DNA-methyltransferase
MKNENKTQEVEKLKGRAMLRWDGKKPLERVDYYPAQEKEVYGDKKSKEFNKLFWGDNLQVLGHLMKEYRGKIDLIYIDPPFDSQADYVKQVKIRGQIVGGEQKNLLEEKQYSDIWARDQYLEFMYERLIILRETLSEKGAFYLHCDWQKAAHLKLICDEVFGEENFQVAITWQRSSSGKTATRTFIDNADIILHYSKSDKYAYNPVFKELAEKTKEMYKYDDNDGRGKYRLYPLQKTAKRTPGTTYDYIDNQGKSWSCPAKGWRMTEDKLRALENDNRLYKNGGTLSEKAYWDERENEGKLADNIWTDIPNLQGGSLEMTDYPTQKPEALLERIITASSSVGDCVLDCFCGSGTTLSVAQQLGRRWIGCDINVGAIQTATKRLSHIIEDQNKGDDGWLLDEEGVALAEKKALFGFKVFNVNDYDIFKNEVEAKEIIMEMYGVEKARMSYFDGVLDNRFVKVMPLNRVLSKKDMDVVIKGIKDNLDSFVVKTKSRHGEAVYEQGVTVFCSGLEMDALDYLKKKNDAGVEVDVRDILLDKQGVIFKQKPEAEISVKPKGGKVMVKIDDFISPILMRKLEIENDKTLKKEAKAKVEDFRQIIDSVAIDVDYDGKLFNAEIIDVPAKNELIKAEYEIEYAKKGKQTLAIKIVDVLGEEYFETFEATV